MKGEVALIIVFRVNRIIIPVLKTKVITISGVLGFSRGLFKGKSVPGVSAPNQPFLCLMAYIVPRNSTLGKTGHGWVSKQVALKTVKLTMTRAASSRALQTGNISHTACVWFWFCAPP